jgi:type III restriction enzyme
MTLFALKKYQTETLAVLQAYLEAARTVGAKPAFDDMDKAGVRAPRSYRPLNGAGNYPLCLLALADRRRQDAAFRPHHQNRGGRLS